MIYPLANPLIRSLVSPLTRDGGGSLQPHMLTLLVSLNPTALTLDSGSGPTALILFL